MNLTEIYLPNVVALKLVLKTQLVFGRARMFPHHCVVEAVQLVFRLSQWLRLIFFVNQLKQGQNIDFR